MSQLQVKTKSVYNIVYSSQYRCKNWGTLPVTRPGSVVWTAGVRGVQALHQQNKAACCAPGQVTWPDGGNKALHIITLPQFQLSLRPKKLPYYLLKGLHWIAGKVSTGQEGRASLYLDNCLHLSAELSCRHTSPIKIIKVASVMKTNGHLVKVKIITASSSVITANCSIVNMGLLALHYHQNNHKTSQIWGLLRPYVATKLYSASQDWRVDHGHATNQV